MAKPHRFSAAVALVCFVLPQWRGTLAASEQQPFPTTALSSASALGSDADGPEGITAVDVAPYVSDGHQFELQTELLLVGEHSRFAIAEPIFNNSVLPEREGGRAWSRTTAWLPASSDALGQRRGYRGGGGRNGAARAEILLGAVGVIAGTAVLVYANRPECRVNAGATGCGYGAKVAGTAVISAGFVSVLVGALTWR